MERKLRYFNLLEHCHLSYSTRAAGKITGLLFCSQTETRLRIFTCNAVKACYALWLLITPAGTGAKGLTTAKEGLIN